MATIQPIAGENEQHPDVALVERVRGGDVSAYDTLVRKYDRQIFRIANLISFSPSSSGADRMNPAVESTKPAVRRDSSMKVVSSTSA